MILAVIAGVFSVFMFLFVFWKHLKDDYVSNQIFTTAFTTLIALSFTVYISYISTFRGWFWISLLACAITIFYNVKRFRMRLIEVVEASVIGFLFIWVFLFGVVFMQQYDYRYLIGVVVTIVFIIMFYLFNSSYKKFSWYKSGRVGFAGFASLFIIFLTRTLVAIRFPDMVSFTGFVDIYLSSFLMLGSLGILIYLSRKT